VRCSPLLLLALTACGRQSLIDHSLWEPVAAEDDPAGDRPETVTCPPSAWFVEVIPEEAIEVDTGVCDYFAVQQPSLGRLRGGWLHLRFGHGDLDAGFRAEAHFALYAADTLLFSQRMEIPAAAWDYTIDLDELEPFPRDTPLTLHLHNHGANTWSFAELSTGR
jgi:hypothetical protein